MSQSGRDLANIEKLLTVQGTDVESSLVDQLGGLRQPQVWVILMKAGGHFAGAVFNG